MKKLIALMIVLNSVSLFAGSFDLTKLPGNYILESGDDKCPSQIKGSFEDRGDERCYFLYDLGLDDDDRFRIAFPTIESVNEGKFKNGRAAVNSKINIYIKKDTLVITEKGNICMDEMCEFPLPIFINEKYKATQFNNGDTLKIYQRINFKKLNCTYIRK